MKATYNFASIFKALADETRLRITRMLSCGEIRDRKAFRGSDYWL